MARFIRSYVAEIGTLEFCLPPQDPNSDVLGLKISTDQFKGMINYESRELVSVTFCFTANKFAFYKGSAKWRDDGS